MKPIAAGLKAHKRGRLVMKCQPLLAIALLLTAAMPGSGKFLSEEKQRSRLKALHTEDVKNMHLTPLDLAYLDAYALLGGNNQCSQFFGGSEPRQVLDELVIRLRIRLVSDSRIGIRMSGTFTSLVEPQGGISYRLFDQAEINSSGAFYRSKTFPAEPLVPNVGSFRPNTREARVLILLHELAHLIKGRDGAWLIPDDGNDAQLSRSNTLTVESRCGQQIRAL
jgi:hypothetical protein